MPTTKKPTPAALVRAFNLAMTRLGESTRAERPAAELVELHALAEQAAIELGDSLTLYAPAPTEGRTPNEREMIAIGAAYAKGWSDAIRAVKP